MINANELRVGNWVKSIVLHGSDFLKFKRFDEDLKIAFFYKEYIGAYIEHIAPIPLTPEILEKCGFEKYIDDWVLDINSVLFVSYNDDDFVHLKSNHIETISSIKHLHQLQNLYFALTGEELTFKP